MGKINEAVDNINEDAYNLYVTIARGLGYADEQGNVNEDFEEFLLGVHGDRHISENWLKRSHNFKSPSNNISIESVLLSEVTGSQHGKYVNEYGSSVLEAFLQLQWDSIMRDYASTLSYAIQKGCFDLEFNKIIDEIMETLITRNRNGEIYSSATIDEDGIILDGNNRLIKLKLFLSMQVAAVQLNPNLTDEEKASKRYELYERFRINVLRQRENEESEVDRY